MESSYLTFCFALLTAVVLSSCGGEEGGQESTGQGEAAELTIPSVEAVQARRGSLPLEERLSGTVKAENQVVIYPEISAPITAVYAENGEYVERGAALARMKARSSQDQLRQAQANLEIARAEAQQARANLEEIQSSFERTKTLAEKELISRQELESQQAQLSSAEANYERAKAQVEQAQAAIEEREEAVRQTVVRAPISGYVGQRNAEVGMRADGSTPLFTIGNMDQMQVDVALTQNMLNHLEVGQKVRVTAGTMGGTVLSGELAHISPFLEASSFSARAEIEVSNEKGLLRPGMFVTADVLYGESQQAVLIPKSALYENPDSGVQGVYVATSLGTEVDPVTPSSSEERAPLTDPTPVTFKEIDVLAEGGSMAGVRGIDDGAWVVTVGQNLLQDRTQGGEPVQARVRPMTWERILALQNLQREDLLRRFMDKQQNMTSARSDTVQATAQSLNSTASDATG